MDGAMDVTLNIGRRGGILRNEFGSILALFSGPLQFLDPNLTELFALDTALEVFPKTGCAFREAKDMADPFGKSKNGEVFVFRLGCSSVCVRALFLNYFLRYHYYFQAYLTE
ncbi:hypothetical protein V6N11_025304 [Hibiscus sabdariffa]|uniref:Uncharacterized protein n=1 Tax=Hibiscus sabdariffa TaxID=183260 RepID=A0ABR2QPP3_9ROSI